MINIFNKFLKGNNSQYKSTKQFSTNKEIPKQINENPENDEDLSYNFFDLI